MRNRKKVWKIWKVGRLQASGKCKKAQKAGEITEDDLKRYEADVQKATDAHIAQIDKVIKAKEEEIMKI